MIKIYSLFFDKQAVTIATLDLISLVKTVPNHGVAERPAPAITRDTVRFCINAYYFGWIVTVFVMFFGAHNHLTFSYIISFTNKGRVNSIVKLSHIMTETKTIEFIDHDVVKGQETQYVTVSVHPGKVLASWRDSVFSFEWLSQDGGVKPLEQLSEPDKAKRIDIERKIQAHEPVTRPVLGIGLMEHVEIGAGKAEFLTLSACGIRPISVHIPKSCQDEFEAYIYK